MADLVDKPHQNQLSVHRIADLVDKPYLNQSPVHQNAIFVDNFIWNSVRSKIRY